MDLIQLLELTVATQSAIHLKNVELIHHQRSLNVLDLKVLSL